MKEIKLSINKVIQPIGEFYISSINANDLYFMSKVDIMTISKNEDDYSYSGIQRKLNEEKVKGIENYLEAYDATFPNSIIVNVNSNKIKEVNQDSMVLEYSNDTFTVIDGQHRINGFRKNKIKDFDLVISMFRDLSETEQSRIFTTINSEQTKVNASIQAYQYIKDEVDTPRKLCASLAILFTTELNSPWRNKIKILGEKDEYSQEGIISLSAFVNPIINMIYDDRDYNKIRNKLVENGNKSKRSILGDFKYKDKILWDLYLDTDEKVFYKILSNYFKVIADILRDDWGNGSSLLTKTTGYNAIMMLFKDLYRKGEKLGKLNVNFFTEQLSELKSYSGKLTSQNYGASGEKAARDLYLDICDKLNIK